MPRSSHALPQHQHHNGTAQAPPPVSSREPPSSLPSPAVSSTRRLGALGIPLPSEDGTDGDDEDAFTPSSTSSSGSLEANPPASPLVPTHDPPEPTYSRGGSTRSGPSTRSGENDGGAFVSEQSFRDIVRQAASFCPRNAFADPPFPLRSTS